MISGPYTTGFRAQTSPDGGFDNDGRPGRQAKQNSLPKSRFGRILNELRRRRVCRAATIYAVTLWLIAQIVETVSTGLGLPDWSMKLVVILGLAGFPIAVVLSWLFDITPDGGSPTGMEGDGARRGTLCQVVDCSLLVVAIVIGSQLAFAVLRPAVAEPRQTHCVVVDMFRAASGVNAGPFAIGLAAEVQHWLVQQDGINVIAVDSDADITECRRLTGAVALDGGNVRATVTLIDGASGSIVWSQIFEREGIDALSVQASLAEAIHRSISRTGAAE